VMSVMLVSLLLISSIGLVSAGLKDWFGFGDENVNLEGELAESAIARLAISDTSAPNVTYVSDVKSDSGLDPSVNVVKLKSKTGTGETLLSFWFVAQQGSGGSAGDLTLPGSSARAYLNRSLETTRASTSCTRVAEVSCGGGIYCPGTGTGMNYSCVVPAKYYDSNGTWSINVSVKTATSNYGYNLTKTFNITSTFAAYAHTKSLNWTNNPLNAGSTNVYSDENITIENNGNVPYSKVEVNATILNGTGSNTGQKAQYIPSNRFNAYACIVNPGVALTTDDYVSVDKFVAPRATSDAGLNSSLGFCVTSLANTPTALSSQLYNSSRAWELRLISS
ncbi:MAG: hypothetical protein WCX73_05890, partial [Candidatus Pacearchaeota archaeon]